MSCPICGNQLVRSNVKTDGIFQHEKLCHAKVICDQCDNFGTVEIHIKMQPPPAAA